MSVTLGASEQSVDVRPFDEMSGRGGEVRAAYEAISTWLDSATPDQLRLRSREAEILFSPATAEQEQ